MVGEWEEDDEDDEEDDEEDDREDEQRRADDRRVRHMLARAPADRSWRRLGWLVLARSCPAKVQLAQDSGGGGGRSDSSTKIAKASHGGGDRVRDEAADLALLVGRVVDLDAEDIFRLVLGFR